MLAKDIPMRCCCQITRPDSEKPIIEAFGLVRENCPALRQVLMPERSWEMFAAHSPKAADNARHCSYLLMAYKRGALHRITSPVHRFLLQSGEPHPRLIGQYRQDLQELWLNESDPVNRHERFKKFFGKIVELQLAEWLANTGWIVTGLAALGAEVDIVVRSPNGKVCSVEVKYIGQRNEDFQGLMKSLAGHSVGGWVSPYSAANYLLFRVYEAARQLKRCKKPRVAAVVIDNIAWDTFELVIEDKWLRWDAAAFYPADREWEQFHQLKQDRYPRLDEELADALRTLDHIWIFRLDGEHRFTFQHEEQMGIKP
jgi:hypothetical protein